MAGLNGCELQVRSYDTEEYRLRPILTRAALEKSMLTGHFEDDEPWMLQAVHCIYRALSRSRLVNIDLGVVNTRETDQKGEPMADIYQMAYHDQRPAFRLAYLKFLEKEIQPLFGEPIVYQTRPSLRVHMPGNVAVGEYHTDAKYSHLPEAVNFWVPANDAFDSSALFVKTSKDERPMSRNVKYGEYMIFDGVNLLHGNELNETGDTRVSFDFRVVPESQFKPSDKASINAGLAFKTGEGGYYSLLNDENVARVRSQLIEEAMPSIEYDESRTGRSIAARLAREAGAIVVRDWEGSNPQPHEIYLDSTHKSE